MVNSNLGWADEFSVIYSTAAVVVLAGTWNLPCGNYSVVFGIKDKPFDRSDKKIIALDSFNASNWDSQIVWDASVRMSRRVRHSGDDFYDIIDSLRQQGPVHGQPLSQVIIERCISLCSRSQGYAAVGPMALKVV
jgi:hypothetical protein